MRQVVAGLRNCIWRQRPRWLRRKIIGYGDGAPGIAGVALRKDCVGGIGDTAGLIAYGDHVVMGRHLGGQEGYVLRSSVLADVIGAQSAALAIADRDPPPEIRQVEGCGSVSTEVGAQ